MMLLSNLDVFHLFKGDHLIVPLADMDLPVYSVKLSSFAAFPGLGRGCPLFGSCLTFLPDDSVIYIPHGQGLKD